MNDGIDETTEYLLEEYALNRLSGEGRMRVEELLRTTPALRARVNELRGEARLFSSTLASSAREDVEPVPDTAMAMLLDGALDELERATLEASLAGDLHSQARLVALYHEANAVINNEPLPERARSAESASGIIVALPPVKRARIVSLDDGSIVAAGLLIAASLFTPGNLTAPVLFLALGFFAWWAIHSAARRTHQITARRNLVFGVLPSLIMFLAGLFSGTYSIWCYVFSAGWYWYWLVQRRPPVEAVSEEGIAQDGEASDRRRGAGRG